MPGTIWCRERLARAIPGTLLSRHGCLYFSKERCSDAEERAMNKWLAVVVLGLSIVAGSLGWRKAVEHFGQKNQAPVLLAQGGSPVPIPGTPAPPSPF